MATLGEFISTITSELEDARYSMDLKSIENAKTYLNHEFLKHFPIPRFKIQDIELNIPLLFNESLTKENVKLSSENNTLNFEVIFDTLRLKNITQETLVRLKLKVIETEMEWNIVDDDNGGIIKKLMV